MKAPECSLVRDTPQAASGAHPERKASAALDESTTARATAFERLVERSNAVRGHPYQSDPLRWTRTPEAAAVASLAMDLIGSGCLAEMEAATIADYIGGDKLTSLAADALRIGSMLLKDRKLWEGAELHAFTAVVCGLRRDDFDAPPLLTAQQVESAAAVVRLVMHYRTEVPIVETGYIEGPPLMQHMALANRQFEALVREHPRDCDRILAYFADRGLNPVWDAPMDELRAWLDSASGPVASGWL